MQTIRDAYISVELQSKPLEGLCSTLRQTLANQGLDCENAALAPHISIGYAQGDVAFDEAHAVAQEIARQSFQVRTRGFEILEGQTTDFYYLVLNLDPDGAFQQAVQTVCQTLPTREFAGGFKGHVSLLRFRKDEASRECAELLAGRLNLAMTLESSLGASSGMAFCECECLEGVCVCVYNPDREKCLQVQFEAYQATMAA